MNGKRAAYLCACLCMTVFGCLNAPGSDANGNDNSSNLEIRDFSGFSSFSYTLTENAGPLFAPALGIVGSLGIRSVEGGGHVMSFSVGDGDGGLLESPERQLSVDQEERMQTLFGEVAIVRVGTDPEGCLGVGITAFSEAFDWDGEAFDRASPCFAPEGISDEDHDALISLLDDLTGEDGTMRSI